MIYELKEDDIINKYLVDVSIPHSSDVPLEVYIAFPKSLEDEEIRNQLRQQWLYGNDKYVVNMDLMFNKTLTAIFRPVGLLVDWKTVTIQIISPSGLNINIPHRLLDELGRTTEQKIANLNDYVYVRFRREGQALVAEYVIPLRGKVEEDAAEEILNKTNYNPLQVLLIGLGLKPTPEMGRIYLPRILSWFKGFDGRPLHIAQFTPPETGKTSFGLRSETLFNWRYISEPPTLARLVLDARTGILGEVFLRDGIVFDELDKWDLSTADRQHTFYTILTGMEQGKWVRGVSAMGIRPPEIPRHIPILFYGNIGEFLQYRGFNPYCTRAFFNEVFSRRFGQDTSALCDRLALVDICYLEEKVMDNLTYKVLPDGIIRGIVKKLQEDVCRWDVSILKGRLKRHSDNVYAVMCTLFKEPEPKLIDAIVSGVTPLDDWVIKGVEKVKQEIPPDLIERR